MVVFAVRDRRDRIDEGHRVEIVVEAELGTDLVATRAGLPLGQELQQRGDFLARETGVLALAWNAVLRAQRFDRDGGHAWSPFHGGARGAFEAAEYSGG